MRNIVFLICLLLASAVAQAGTDGVSLRDQLREKLVCDTGGCMEVQSGTFQVKYQFTGVIPEVFANLDAQSTVTLQFGSFEITKLLGDDPNYQPGDESVSFVSLIKVIDGGNPLAGRMKVSWKNEILKISFKGYVPQTQDPVAYTLLNTAPGKDKQVDAPLRISLEGNGASFTNSFSGIPLTGSLSRKTKVVDGTSHDLDKISLSGTF
jgi:hypothetical protein